MKSQDLHLVQKTGMFLVDTIDETYARIYRFMESYRQTKADENRRLVLLLNCA